MEDRSYISPPRRWLESILVWYIVFMIGYLILRFVVQTGWRFISLVNNTVPYLYFLVIIGLLIALLLRKRRLSGVYFLVGLIGVFHAGIPLMPASLIPADEGTSVKIVSYNLYPDNREPGASITWTGEQGADIIALQEIPVDSEPLSALDERYEYQVVQGMEAGLAVYSRYPVTRAEDILLEDRAVQRLLLDIEGQDIVFYNVKIYQPLNDRNTDWLVMRYDESRRDRQIELLLDHVRRESLPVIVAGDFNMTQFSPVYGQIRAELEDAYRRVSWGIGATFPAGASEKFHRSYPRMFRIDYVWYSSDSLDVVSAFVGDSPGSDHVPLVVELIIP